MASNIRENVKYNVTHDCYVEVHYGNECLEDCIKRMLADKEKNMKLNISNPSKKDYNKVEKRKEEKYEKYEKSEE